MALDKEKAIFRSDRKYWTGEGRLKMPGKNHIRIDGMLIQTDKKFSALKERQKT